ncbi:hypothetical protein IAQ61_003542 [Plenodomus lingam]|uniref:uncharacterized protein n=1 Tax=Leptosphaeria maculans TaxID=5022 RepID=UPI00331F5741|nr:hypothetical protein IAQ61_003542 [Plenodomus lingam]
MLSIQSSQPQKVTPNLLPLLISHNGPIHSASRFFTPSTDPSSPSNNTQHAHFRGRHLHGTPVALPEGYTGAVLHLTGRQLPPTRRQPQEQRHGDESGGEDAEEEDMDVQLGVADQVGEFDELVVWGHGAPVEESRDAYVRGLEEWVGFAESMHCDEDEQETQEKKT